MGIPSYFSYIVKNYPHIIRKYTKDSLCVDNLYLDCNSIIYDAYNKLDIPQITEPVSKTVIRQVIRKIEEYIFVVQPQQTVFIAFDGVAPLAKLKQQRSRRYKSWYQNEVSRILFQKEKKDVWNTAAITPGTTFMAELNQCVASHFRDGRSPQIRVSGSNEVGEGEHKLFAYIRDHPAKHASETTVIYGLDADLIMLSVNHLPVCPNIYLFRETPHFIQSIDNSLEPDADYFLDIPEFVRMLTAFMTPNTPASDGCNKDNKDKNTVYVYDYIFLCFFLGNDFLPHFPALNIRTGGVDKMLNAYRATLGTTDTDRATLTRNNGTIIQWENVRKVVRYLADQEEEYICEEYRARNRKEHYKMACTTPEEKFKRFELTPMYKREMEHFINPTKPGWQNRYYQKLLHIEQGDDDQKIQELAVNYIEGLEWTMKYYTTGCPDWRWRYRFDYPPLLRDLLQVIPLYPPATDFVPVVAPNPVSEMVQLCYVLPRTSLTLLPERMYFELLRKHDDWYRGDCAFVWAYCRYFWEAHVEMNEIDVEELERFITRETKVSPPTPSFFTKK